MPYLAANDAFNDFQECCETLSKMHRDNLRSLTGVSDWQNWSHFVEVTVSACNFDICSFALAIADWIAWQFGDSHVNDWTTCRSGENSQKSWQGFFYFNVCLTVCATLFLCERVFYAPANMVSLKRNCLGDALISWKEDSHIQCRNTERTYRKKSVLPKIVHFVYSQVGVRQNTKELPKPLFSALHITVDIVPCVTSTVQGACTYLVCV